jgi:hypothetical protein
MASHPDRLGVSPQAAPPQDGDQTAIPSASFATVTNMGGREWIVRVLEDDGVAPAKNCPSPAEWVEQYYKTRNPILSEHRSERTCCQYEY